MPQGVIKQTHDEMMHIASSGQSLCEDYSAQTRALVNVANELAVTHMRGAAGTAVLTKTTELQATVDRMTHTASEKYQGIGNFAQAGLNSAHEAQSRIMAIQSA